MNLNTILLIGTCVLFVGMSIPLMLEKVEPNPIYGFRIPKTLKNKFVWYKANKFLGYAVGIAASLTLLCLTLKLLSPTLIPLSEKPYFDIVVFILPLTISIIISTAYVFKL